MAILSISQSPAIVQYIMLSLKRWVCHFISMDRLNMNLAVKVKGHILMGSFVCSKWPLKLNLVYFIVQVIVIIITAFNRFKNVSNFVNQLTIA